MGDDTNPSTQCFILDLWLTTSPGQVNKSHPTVNTGNIPRAMDHPTKLEHTSHDNIRMFQDGEILVESLDIQCRFTKIRVIHRGEWLRVLARPCSSLRCVSATKSIRLNKMIPKPRTRHYRSCPGETEERFRKINQLHRCHQVDWFVSPA